MKEKYDKLKIEKTTWYAWGEYRNNPTGRKFANENAQNIRNRGGKARLVIRKTGIQVYANNKKYLP
jgi:hypothetical protein